MFDINDEECPVLVCERCGYVIRAFVYQEDDVYTCDFCDTIMTKTRFSLTNDETALTLGMTRESIDFLDDIFFEYVKESPKFDSNKLRERQVKDIEYLRRYLP